MFINLVVKKTAHILLNVNLSIQIYLDVLWMASGDEQVCSSFLEKM